MNKMLQGALKCSQRWPLLGFTRKFAYKSDLSLEVLYPKSKQKLFTPSPPSATEKFNGYIPIETLQITYSRSSGPGGQNVNKVDTKVDLRFHVNTAEWIPEPIRQKLVASYKNQINKDGYFVIKSELTRYQHMNVADALEKVRNLIRKLEEDSVETQLSPEKLEKIRRNKEKFARERLFQKRVKSQSKADRRN